MAILLIISVILLVMLTGMVLAFIFSRADRVVTSTRTGMVAEEKAYNPGVTLGHKIKVESGYDDQLKQARQVAAKRAAALPRGANARIGRAGQSTLATASKGLQNDPQTAVRIARFHGWDGARVGPTAAAVAAAPAAVAGAPAAAPRAAAPAPAAGIAPPQLIAITPDMSPEEVRKARVANAKAESAYNKAVKAAAGGAVAAAPTAVAAPAGAPAGAAAPVAIGIEPPKLIAITPDMSPEDVRKARVANAKAESAYNKALKAAGVGAAVAAAAPVEAQAPVAAPVAAAPVVTGIAPPQLIAITPEMSPEEVRKARVANAKAESAYNKALKAAGVDPAVAKGGGAPVAAVAAVPAGAAALAVEAVPAQPAAIPAQPAAAPTAVPGIDPPQLIEITDSMTPEQVRRARVENAKAQSAYNKALKAAGIDPASLK